MFFIELIWVDVRSEQETPNIPPLHKYHHVRSKMYDSIHNSLYFIFIQKFICVEVLTLQLHHA